MYIYKHSNLYRYKCFAFQYVENSSHRLHKVMRILVCGSMWCCLILELYNFINGFNESAERSFFGAAVLKLHRSVWMLRYVLLHNVGMYLFAKHPDKIQKEVDILYQQNKEDEHENITNRIKKYERKTKNLMVLSVIFLILLPLLQKVVTIFYKRSLNINSTKVFEAFETIELITIPYTRIMSMPFFFNLIFLAHIQCLKIKYFTKNLKVTNNPKEQTNTINSYVELHNSVKKTSKDFHVYVIFLLTLLLFWGTLGAYYLLEKLQHLSKSLHGSHYFAITKFLVDLLTVLLETLFLYTVPLLTLGKVSNTQKKVLPKILKENCSLNSALDIAKWIEKLQSADGTGYKIFDNSLTQLNTIWLGLLGPIFTVIAGVIINEHF